MFIGTKIASLVGSIKQIERQKRCRHSKWRTNENLLTVKQSQSPITKENYVSNTTM